MLENKIDEINFSNEDDCIKLMTDKDIILKRCFVNELGIPMHSVMVTGFDGKGFPIPSYSNGSGVYKTTNTMHRTLENPGWTANYYRYVGTPAERQAIAEHNEAVRAKNASSAQRISSPVEGIPVQPVQLPKRRLTIFDIAKGAE